MTEKTRQFDTGRKRLSINDGDGVEIASFFINPTDIGLLKRAREVADRFEHHPAFDEKGGADGVDALSAYNDEIEEQILYLLGYDARSTLFGSVTATTVSPSGEMFAYVVLKMIADEIAPELEARGRAMKKRAETYTAKYAGGDERI